MFIMRLYDSFLSLFLNNTYLVFNKLLSYRTIIIASSGLLWPLRFIGLLSYYSYYN